MRHVRVVACGVLAVLAVAAPAAAAPEGQLTWGVHISLAPTWFDPAETQGLITPFMVLYAVHDAMAKAMPGSTAAPSLAESWQVSPDGRVYDFTLRKGVKFHNGDLLTSEDVKFSFDRYRGAAAKTLKERVAALKRGEIDIVYSIRGELAEELQRSPGLVLKPTVIQAPQWVSMLDQWDPKSPWHDRRVRLAANLAIDRKAINEAITLGHSRLTYSIIPSTFDFYWQPPAYAFDPAQAKKLLAEAGYRNGFDAGEYYLDGA